MNTQQPDPPLPRKPEDLSEIRRLRQEALRHLDAEEHAPPSAVDGAPAPVYGGPASVGSVTRRWTLRRLLLLIAALLAGLAAALFGVKRSTAPVYGGPPIPPPRPDGSGNHPNPVYGGPLPPSSQPPQPKEAPRPKTAPGAKPVAKPHFPTPAPLSSKSGPLPGTAPQPVAAKPLAPDRNWRPKPSAGVYGGPPPFHPWPNRSSPPATGAPVYGGPPPRPVAPPAPAPNPANPAAPPQNPAPQDPQ